MWRHNKGIAAAVDNGVIWPVVRACICRRSSGEERKAAANNLAAMWRGEGASRGRVKSQRMSAKMEKKKHAA